MKLLFTIGVAIVVESGAWTNCPNCYMQFSDDKGNNYRMVKYGDVNSGSCTWITDETECSAAGKAFNDYFTWDYGSYRGEKSEGDPEDGKPIEQRAAHNDPPFCFLSSVAGGKGEVLYFNDIKSRAISVSTSEQNTGDCTGTDVCVCKEPSADPVCPNGVIESGEQCDDNNVDNTDDCRNDCTVPTCSDGIVDSNEECDKGNDNGDYPDACRSNCLLPRCQDGIVDSTEECDDPNADDTSVCTSECTLRYRDDADCGLADKNVGGVVYSNAAPEGAYVQVICINRDANGACTNEIRYCKWCPAGKAQSSATNTNGPETCVACSAGGFILPGDAGTYMPHKGASTCRECRQGWYTDVAESQQCKDVDECKPDHQRVDHTANWSVVENKCHKHAFCNNTDGSFACVCKPGYHGDGEASGLGCWGNWGVQTWYDGTNKWVTLEVSRDASDHHPHFPVFGEKACATSGYSAISKAECLHDAKSATGCATRWDSSACLCSAGTVLGHHTDSGFSQHNESTYSEGEHPWQTESDDVGVSVQICKVGTERKASWKTAATYADNMLHFYKQSQNALTRMTDKMQITDSLWHKICEDAKAEAKAAISQFHDAIVKYSNSVTSFNAAMSLMKGDQTTMKGNEIKMNEAIQTWMGAQSARAQAHRRHFEFHTLLGLNFPKRQNSWRPAKDFMKKRHNIGPRVWDGTQYILPTNGHTHDIYRAIKGVKNDGETMMDGRDPNKDDVTEWWHSPDRA